MKCLSNLLIRTLAGCVVGFFSEFVFYRYLRLEFGGLCLIGAMAAYQIGFLAFTLRGVTAKVNGSTLSVDAADSTNNGSGPWGSSV